MSSWFGSVVRAATVAMGGVDAPSFPYTLGVEHTSAFPSPHWRLFAATHDTTGDAVTIFSFDKARADPASLHLAKNHVLKLKTLRHPHVLRFVDSSESSSHLLMATEECRPFTHEFERGSKAKESSTSLGLYQILSAIAWLNNECKLVHAALSPAAIFVLKSGEFRLGAFDLCYKHGDVTTASAVSLNTLSPAQRTAFLPLLYRSPEFARSLSIQAWIALETGDASSSSPVPIHYIDSWALGVLIFDLHANGTLSSPAQLANKDVVPPSLQTEYKRLLSTNPVGRLNPKSVLESAYFAQNELIRTINFLNELTLKNSEEKDLFFTSFARHVADFPAPLSKYKILPLLVSALTFGASMACFPHIFSSVLKIGSSLSSAEFQSMILPPIVKLFASNERAVRVHLLTHVESYAAHLSESLINEQLFAHICTGFGDSQPMLREVTVKSMPSFMARLNGTNLALALGWLSRLQGDPEPAIRTNTTYCIAKMATSFDAPTREKVLIPAFTRALRDAAFAPARIAGLVALTATLELYGAMACARRVLPLVAPVCVDEAKEVREAALKCLNAISVKLAQFHSDGGVERPLPATLRKSGEVSTDAAVAAASSLLSNVSSWAVSSFANKFYSSSGAGDIGSGSSAPLAKSASTSQLSAPSPTAASSSSSSSSSSSPAHAIAATAPSTAHSSPHANPAVIADGWGDEFDIDELADKTGEEEEENSFASLSISTKKTKTTPSKAKPAATKKSKAPLIAAPIENDAGNDSDDGFESKDNRMPSSSSSSSSSASASLDEFGDFNDFAAVKKQDTSSFDPFANSSSSSSSPASSSPLGSRKKAPLLLTNPPFSAAAKTIKTSAASSSLSLKQQPNANKKSLDDFAAFLQQD